MEQGDIVWADDRKKHPHPIIFMKENGYDSFYGCIITHEKEKGNVEMKPEYFEIQNDKGENYEVQYDKSYLILYKFIKLKNWISNTEIVGKLTEEGVRFVIENTPTDDKAVMLEKPIWEM